MTQPVGNYTVLEAVTYVKEQFGDESGVQINDAKIIGWINLAMLEIASKVRALQKTVVFPGTANTQEYALPVDIINVEGARYGDYALTHVATEEALRTLGIQVTSNSGQPAFFWVYSNSMYLYPKPDKNADLVIRYKNTPPRVATLADIIPFPNKYYPRILEYALSEAYKLDENIDSYQSLRQTFEDKLTENRGQEKEISGAWTVITEVGYSDNSERLFW